MELKHFLEILATLVTEENITSNIVGGDTTIQKHKRPIISHCEMTSWLRPRAALTHLGLVRLPVLRQLDELLGEHAAAVAQDVTFQLHVRARTHELHDDGVAGGVDPDLHVLTPH